MVRSGEGKEREGGEDAPREADGRGDDEGAEGVADLHGPSRTSRAFAIFTFLAALFDEGDDAVLAAACKMLSDQLFLRRTILP